MGVGQMQGTPWHVETLKRPKGDKKRHRSRCLYYQKSENYCSKYCERCRGSAYCNYYREIKRDDKEKLAKNPSHSPKEQSALSWADARVGDSVQSTRFGDGVIVRLEGKKVTVRFKDGTERDFVR